MPHISKNKLAYFDYKILETLEAGLVLTGPEVKSVKKGQINLKGSYVTIRNNEAWLINCHISPYKMAQREQRNYDPTQPRKLLLKRKEIDRLVGQAKTPGLTILPLNVYTKNRLIKLEIGVGKGKKKFDKRDLIKKREIAKKIQRVLRQKI